MKALVWDGSSLTLREDYPDPETCGGAGSDALVKVHLAGICSTDLQLLQGYMGFRGVPGHEFVGHVVDGAAPLRGRRVVGEINFACGRCAICGQGLPRHCPARRVMGILNADGAFAEYVSVPAVNLHVVPDRVSDAAAVFTEPLAAAFEILEQVPVSPGDTVLVLGDGKLGNLCAQVLRLASAHVTVLGRHEEKLRLLRRRGVRAVAVSEWAPRLFDIVVEATGSAAGLESALGAVRPRGTLILKSTVAARHEVSLAPLVINEINVVGSRCGPFAPALEALEEQMISVTPLIEKTYPLTDGVQAVAHARRRGARKVLLQAEP